MRVYEEVEGKLHGIENRFYPEGSLRETTEWFLGNKHGMQIKYDRFTGTVCWRTVF